MNKMCIIFDILFVADKEKEMGGVEDFTTILEVSSFGIMSHTLYYFIDPAGTCLLTFDSICNSVV